MTLLLEPSVVAEVDLSTVMAVGAAAGASFAAAAVLIYARLWPVWAAVGLGTAAFFVSYHTEPGAARHMNAAFGAGMLSAFVLAGVAYAVLQLHQWLNATHETLIWMGTLGVLMVLAGATNLNGDAPVAASLGVFAVVFGMLTAITQTWPTSGQQKANVIAPSCAAIPLIILAGWIASTPALVSYGAAFKNFIGDPFDTGVVMSIAALAAWRARWSPLFLAAAIGLAFGAEGGFLVWPLLCTTTTLLWWRAHTTAPHLILPLFVTVWSALAGTFLRGWILFGSSSQWGAWAIAAGLSIALLAWMNGATSNNTKNAQRGS